MSRHTRGYSPQNTFCLEISILPLVKRWLIMYYVHSQPTLLAFCANYLRLMGILDCDGTLGSIGGWVPLQYPCQIFISRLLNSTAGWFDSVKVYF